ncbi:MAG: TRAP transporter small permease subunit [Piscirickettsiaceae bacterium]|jgi:TRAP-type mannitol/chloroaromatic compound transport system permease small subunit|nr:TRAP transporter small permease subunit [Piscirickettsiaceae bacterium]
MKSFVLIVDAIVEWVGRTASWLILAMVLLICYDVAMRYLFQQGSVALQELEWHLFALIFLLGSAYTLKHDQHVRVDIIYQSRFVSDKQRALINIFGTLFLLLPFCILVLITSWPFVENAFYYHEGSPDPGGLPHRFLLKGSLLLAFGLLILQGLAEILRNIIKLSNHSETQ